MSFETTVWKNPTAHDMTVRVFVGPGESTVFRIPAGGAAAIPSTFDKAINVLRGGVVVGGLAPMAQREGQPVRPVHKSLRQPPPVAPAAPAAPAQLAPAVEPVPAAAPVPARSAEPAPAHTSPEPAPVHAPEPASAPVAPEPVKGPRK
jgi:hypothetical protein